MQQRDYLPGANGRIPELDGVRGIAILLVLVWHYFSTQVVSEPGTLVSTLIGLARISWSGVDLFFVLSGFLIASVLLDNAGKPNVFRAIYIRRACRILPLYLVMVGLFLLSRPLAPPAFDWLYRGSIADVAYLTFTQNFAISWQNDLGARWLDMTWSLAVEEQFYLLLPLLLLIVPFRIGLGLIVIMIAAAPVLRYAFSGNWGAYVLPFCRADSLLLGVVCAVLVRHRIWVDRQPLFRRWLPVVVGVMLGGTLVALLVRAVVPGGVFIHACLAIFCAAFLLMALSYSGGVLTSPLRSRVTRWPGERSYGIYLLHQPVAGLIHGYVMGGAPAIQGPTGALVTLAALGVAFLLAELSFRYFESPFVAFGRRVPYDQRPLAKVHAA